MQLQLVTESDASPLRLEQTPNSSDKATVVDIRHIDCTTSEQSPVCLVATLQTRFIVAISIISSAT